MKHVPAKGSKRTTGAAGRGGGGKNSIISGKGNRSALSMVVEPWMPLFPAYTTRRLRYSDNFLLTTTAGALTTYVIRANDLYDPNFTGTGHQPMGFDQMMVVYNHFCVVRASIKVTFKNGSNNSVSVGVRTDGSSTALTVIDRMIEIGGLVQTELGYLSSGISANQTVEASVDIARMQGVSRTALTADPSLRGDAATSPTEVTYFHLCAWDVAGATSTVETSIILEQTATFMEPRDLTESLSSLRIEKKTPALRRDVRVKS